MASSEVIGRLLSPWPIMQATLTVLREWLPVYLAEVERQEGLTAKSLGRPENPVGYYPCIDFMSAGPGATVPAHPPVVIVTCIPQGEPEMIAEAYMQQYHLGIGCVVEGDTEEEALMKASLFGAASMLLGQLGALGGIAERTVMIQAPRVEAYDAEPAQRRLMRSEILYQVFVSEILSQSGPWAETITASPEIPTEVEAEPGTRPLVVKSTATLEAKDP